MPIAFFNDKPTSGTTNGFKGVLTNGQGQHEVDFDDQTIATSDGTTVTDASWCAKYSCATYDAAPGGKAQNIVLYTSVDVEGTLSGADMGQLIRSVAQKLKGDAKDTILKIVKR